MRILQIVKSGSGHSFFVVDSMPVLVYHREKNIITGTDGVFYSCFYHHNDQYAKAFAGRPFQLLLDTGETIECHGDWWDGSYPNIPLSLTPINTIEGLKRCYVYIGYNSSTPGFQKLIKEYKGTVREYFEYEKMLKAL